MKSMTLLLAAGCFALGVVPGASAATALRGTDSPEVEYLRRLMAEQQKHPDKIIRSRPAPNAPAATTAAAPDRPAPETPNAVTTKPTPSPERASEKTGATPTPDEVARQKRISDVEARLDEMLKQKEAREKAA